jgi:hypothetical protein
MQYIITITYHHIKIATIAERPPTLETSDVTGRGHVVQPTDDSELVQVISDNAGARLLQDSGTKDIFNGLEKLIAEVD